MAKSISREKENCYKLINDAAEIIVNADDGMNIISFRYKDIELISFNEKRYLDGATYGIPVLFPTPNRTRDSFFSFQGKAGKAAMHGFARKSAFEITKASSEDSVSITGSLKVEKGSRLYELYPYACTLRIEITLEGKELQYSYEVHNKENRSMPFGLGLHPFFNKRNRDTKVSLRAGLVMEKDEQFLPTGRLLSTGDTSYELSEQRYVHDLLLDDVYYNPYGISAAIKYTEFSLTISGSDNFTHMVVYTPEKENFFCVEPQTCSTDAINMYEKGYRDISGLSVLSPGETSTGKVVFQIKD
jgi:aldose 1-epimerase